MKRPAVLQPAAILQALVAPVTAPQASLTTSRYFPHYFCGAFHYACSTTTIVAVTVTSFQAMA